VSPEQRAQLVAAIRSYNRGDYFAAQAPLEDLYNTVDGDERALAQALLMAAAGMHLHFHRGGGRGVLNLFRQSLMVLDELRPRCAGVATGEFYEALEAYLQDVQERRKPGANFFDRWLAPRITLAA
jgi:predicted metal-dependent hydrolase